MLRINGHGHLCFVILNEVRGPALLPCNAADTLSLLSGMTNTATIEESTPRDPEDRHATTEKQIREKNLDKTLADSFPTSDPPSSIPDPAEEES